MPAAVGAIATVIVIVILRSTTHGTSEFSVHVSNIVITQVLYWCTAEFEATEIFGPFGSQFGLLIAQEMVLDAVDQFDGESGDSDLVARAETVAQTESRECGLQLVVGLQMCAEDIDLDFDGPGDLDGAGWHDAASVLVWGADGGKEGW
jgi:hypothetical protein